MTNNAAPSNSPARNDFFSRWSRIAEFAKLARGNQFLFFTSAVFAVAYNIVGSVDIMTTFYGIHTEQAVEGNPIIALFMESLSHGWIIAKLALQLLVTFMILFYPHRIVLAIFTVSLGLTAYAVFNNLQILGVI